LRWELDLLAELGYGLDFSACTVTGATENLSWVSPRTGRAVSQAAGADYADRLLILPRLLGGLGRPGETDPGRDLMDGLALTGHFLDRHLFAARAKIPASRGHFMDRLRRLTELGV
jgi:DNA repair protein RecO (recombination protein O)